MTETFISPIAQEGTEPGEPSREPLPPRMIPVDQLAAHPGNVRQDLDLTPEFLASVAEMGVRFPLLVTLRDDGGWLVIEGHRRLAAAIKAGLAEVPCVLDPGRASDQAGQFLDMVIANSDGHRRNFTPAEEAAALFAASEAGASRTRLRKSTGRNAGEIKTALAAGGISEQTRATAGNLAGQLTLDELALLAEFDGDPDAVAKMVEAFRHGHMVEYTAEWIRRDRAEAAEHDQVLADLAAAGVPVTDGLPNGAIWLDDLLHDGGELTPEAHAACPGRGAYFPRWSKLQPVHYCASPAEHGHVQRNPLPAPAGDADDDAAGPGSPPGPAASPDPDPDRRLVIEGNKAWKAACEVRKRWLATQFFARRAAPGGAARFAARELLTMPPPLCSGLAIAHSRPLFEELTRQRADNWLEICDTTTAARLPLLILGPLITAYEQAMSEGEGKNTWRTGRYSPCPRRDAGRYLKFLASAGYELSPIEQALADNVPYTGDTPPRPVPGDGAQAEDDAGETGAAIAADGGGGQDDAQPEAA